LIASDFNKLMSEFEKVSFVETFRKPEAASQAKPQQAKAQASK
jgi:hypothetical protein